MALLDRIYAGRYDVEAVLTKLNEYTSLTDAEMELEDEGPLGYADVEPHPLTALCGEADNAFLILRDITGDLEFVWEEDIRTGVWQHGPLFQGNLSQGELDWYLESDGDLGEIDISLTADELRMVVSLLPDDPPGPLRSF